ncbi:hypothetical protein [Altererythrobacter litoralis]|uniref:DUF3052 family protein n=1 Tax=Altererythrobacter litoralis TaxID=3113904 RepID=A0ABU7GG61_9SPHN|nr:hypothetical protein [Erythrobacteraceae bacterium 1XM1-14]
MAGYSGTPLAKKLSLKRGLTAWFHEMPEPIHVELAEADVQEQPGPIKDLDVAHIFVTRRTELEHLLTELRHTIALNGFVWVSWPKKASKVATDITEDTIREIGLPLGFVDVKVCAVDQTWSGLKLMIRKELR